VRGNGNVVSILLRKYIGTKEKGVRNRIKETGGRAEVCGLCSIIQLMNIM